MKFYNHTNFFKHTFCEFEEVANFNFPENSSYKSASNSFYFYTKEGVYRKSNHWGRVANCRWKIVTKSKYKNQQSIIGFAKWSDFFPLNTNEKNFIIKVDFHSKTSKIIATLNKQEVTLFTLKEAQLRNKEVKKLLQEKNWLRYLVASSNKEKYIQNAIQEFISSEKSIPSIKKSFIA